MSERRFWHRNSGIRRFPRCPLSTWLGYYAPQLEDGWEPEAHIDDFPWLRYDPFDRGRSAHKALQIVFEAHVEGRERPDLRAVVRAVCLGQSHGVEAEVMDVVIPFVESLDRDPVNPANVIGVEQLWKVEVDGRRFMFRPDVVELNMEPHHPRQGVIVTDWKTDWRVQNQTDFERDPQLTRYAVGLLERYPRVPRFILRKRFVRYPGVVRETEIEASALAWARDDLAARMVEIDAVCSALVESGQEPEAIGGDWCGSCGFKPRCPVIKKWSERWPDVRPAPYPETLADATTMMQEARALGAHADDIRVRVIEWAADNFERAIESADGYYSWAPKDWRDPPQGDDLANRCTAANEDVMRLLPYLKLDLKAFDKALEKRKLPTLLLDLVGRAITRSVRTEWRWTQGTPPAHKPLAERTDVPGDTPPGLEGALDLMAALKGSLKKEPKPKPKRLRGPSTNEEIEEVVDGMYGPPPSLAGQIADKIDAEYMGTAENVKKAFDPEERARTPRCIGCGREVSSVEFLYCSDCEPIDIETD